MPAHVPARTNRETPSHPGNDPQHHNRFAALANVTGEETPCDDTSSRTDPSNEVGEDTRTHASVASSSSGSSDALDQLGWSTMTKLSGLRHRQSAAGTQPHKRERTPKNKSRTLATPNTATSIANDVCSATLSPIMGKMYKHNSSEEVSVTNLSNPEADKKPLAQPDIEEGIRVKESKRQETDINIQSSLSSPHPPIAQRTRLARSTSHERESGPSPGAHATRFQSLERVNVQATML